MSFSRLLTLAAFLVCPGWALAQADADKATGQTQKQPSAESIERALNQNRPKPSPITPVGPNGAALPPLEGRDFLEKSDELLWPEGFKLVIPRGRLQWANSKWHLAFSTEEEANRHMLLEVLLNSKLKKMERFSTAGNRTVEFSIQGDITEYKNANFLLVRDVTTLRAVPQERPTTQPVVTDQPPSPAATTSQIMDALEKDAQQDRLLPTTTRPANPKGFIWSPTEVSSLWPEDTRQSDRVGRLLKEGEWWTYTFESHSNGPADPPIQLLPNLALENMEKYAQGTPRSAIFVVSGDITEYAGQNYMLIKRWRIKAASGNIR